MLPRLESCNRFQDVKATIQGFNSLLWKFFFDRVRQAPFDTAQGEHPPGSVVLREETLFIENKREKKPPKHITNESTGPGIRVKEKEADNLNTSTRQHTNTSKKELRVLFQLCQSPLHQVTGRLLVDTEYGPDFLERQLIIESQDHRFVLTGREVIQQFL